MYPSVWDGARSSSVGWRELNGAPTEEAHLLVVGHVGSTISDRNEGRNYNAGVVVYGARCPSHRSDAAWLGGNATDVAFQLETRDNAGGAYCLGGLSAVFDCPSTGHSTTKPLCRTEYESQSTRMR